MVNDDRFIDDTLKSDDLQEDTFNEDHNSMFSGDEQMKRSSARKHRMIPDAGKGILWTLTGLALAACGGGTVTGGTALPGEPTGLPEEGLAVLSFDQARELGGGGGDRIVGGRTGTSFNDIASYENSAAGVTVSLAGDGSTHTGDAAGDSFVNIRNLQGATHNDTITGDANNNIIDGRVGADRIDGGDGNDTASYDRSNAVVTVSLVTGAGTGGHAAGDTLSNIENISGSAHDDTLTGNDENNILIGGGGNDTITTAAVIIESLLALVMTLLMSATASITLMAGLVMIRSVLPLLRP